MSLTDRSPESADAPLVLASARFAEVWSAANRLAHERAVAILREETSRATVDDGTVTLELGQASRSIGESVGIPDAELDRIPADAGVATAIE